MLDLLGVAIAGGMFVVPLYAFLTTTVPKSETARTVAANNIVNSGAMVVATLMLTGLVLLGVSVAETLFLVAVGKHRRGLARLQAPPRLRLSRRPRLENQDGYEQEADREGRREKLEVGKDCAADGVPTSSSRRGAPFPKSLGSRAIAGRNIRMGTS